MKSLDTLINAETRAAIEQNNCIKQVISRIVPASSAAHIEFCRIEGGRLRVTVDNAAWVAKLRFGERQIIRSLKAQQLDVHTVSWHVSPPEKPVPRITRRKPNQLSTQSAAYLEALAATEEPQGVVDELEEPTDSGEKLRQELLKLAAKLRQ